MINIIKYENDDIITKKISRISDARLIWGGDKTVDKIKSILTQSRCNDIAFPDRYSLTIINLDKISMIMTSKMLLASFISIIIPLTRMLAILPI